ncbi:MAG: outer membrane lipoprotein carrier protein LolA [Bacteroidota bacterium]
MNKRTYILVFMLLLLAGGISAQNGFKPVKNQEAVLAELNKTAAETHTITADFTEEKTMAAFSKPQFGKGKFYYAEKDKLRWEQVSPFDYVIVINGKSLSIRENGKIKKISGGNRSLGRVSEFLLNMVQGNFRNDPKLPVKCFESSSQYLVELTPTNSPLGKIYKNLKLYFSKTDKRLQGIEFFEANGDRRTMKFFNQVYNKPVASTFFTLQ